MEDKELYEILRKTAKDNPDRYIAVLEDGSILISETREKLFQKAMDSGIRVRGIGHGINRKYKHFVY
jgi:hypothetical protein